jgi:uncharacterized RDD family membrane protein YckC
MNKASFFQRLAAWSIDRVILLIITLLAATAFRVVSGMGIDTDITMREPNALLSLSASVFMLAIAFADFLYFGYFWSRQERSIGMGMMNIKVVKTDGRPLSFLMAGLRGTFGYYVSGLIFGLGYLWFFVDKQQQTWHDKIFNTVVLTQ